MTLKYINFCPYLKITRSGKVKHQCQSGNDQPEQGTSSLTSTCVSVQHMQHMCLQPPYTQSFNIIYPLPISIWIWDYCFQVPTNQSPPAITAIVIFQHNDNHPGKEDELQCPRSKDKAGDIFQMRIELTYLHFFCLPICIQCFLKWIAGVYFSWMFN